MVCCRQLLAPAGQALSLGLSLRPHDPIAKKLVSREVPVQNVLLRVSIPRRTGRKRKRGSDEPFAFHPDPTLLRDEEETVLRDPQPLDASQLLRRLGDTAGKHVIQPVGTVRESHRFRGMAFLASLGVLLLMLA